MRRTLSLTFISILISMLVTGVVFARDMIQGEQCIVGADEVVDGSLFTFCQELHIEGKVTGNILGIALRATITGEVTGNVYIAGAQLNHSGLIRGDLHYAGITLDVYATDTTPPQRPVLGQIVFATLSSHLGETIIVPGRVTGIGYQLLIDAQVNQEINFWGSALILTNLVNSDVYATVGNPESDASDLEPLLLPLDIQQEFVLPGLLITASGTINGQLAYIGPAPAEISGTVNGLVQYTTATPVIIPIVPEEGTFNIFVTQFIRELTVLLTVGVIGLALAPNVFQTPISNLRWRPVPSFVIGMLMFIVSFPIALILLLLTTIISLILLLLQLDGVLIVVASFLMLLDVGIIGIFYFTAIFVARAVFALGLGRFLIRSTIGHDGSQRMNLLSLVTGVVVIAFLAALPAVGFLFNAAALFMGLGAITNVALEWLQNVRNTSYQMSYNRYQTQPLELVQPSFPQSPQQPSLPPPSNALGLTDLPDGFDPSFFLDDED